MSDLTERLTGRLLRDRSRIRLLALTALLLIAFSAFSPDRFLSLLNFQSMGLQVGEVGLLSLAVMLSMLTGGIDLSIVAVADLAAITSATLLASRHAQAGDLGTVAMCLLAGLAVGLCCGLLNGLLITRGRITPILATLGTMQLLNGIGIIWTKGVSVQVSQDDFLNIGNGVVAGVPVPFAVLLLAALAVAVLINRTGLGLRLKLVGANPTAARFAGIDNERVVLLAYLASGLLAAVAGILIASRSASASADYGASYVLLAIVIAVLGGVNINGGYATVTGILLAALCLQILASGFDFLGLNQFVYEIAQGAILIVILAIDALGRRGQLRLPRRLTQAREP